MSKIFYKNLLDFIASELDESNYFNCSDKKSLISLKEYLNDMQKKNEEYIKLISEPLKSIQNKNKWVEDIRPSHDLNDDGLLILGNKESILLLGIDPNLSKRNSNDYIIIGSSHMNSFLNLKMNKREKILENSQEELHEINRVCHELNILENPFITVSGYFFINPSKYDFCKINYLTSEIMYFIPSTGILNVGKDIESKVLTLEEGNKLVKKLYIKNYNNK